MCLPNNNAQALRNLENLPVLTIQYAIDRYIKGEQLKKNHVFIYPDFILFRWSGILALHLFKETRLLAFLRFCSRLQSLLRERLAIL
jgi:hypothetical protein